MKVELYYSLLQQMTRSTVNIDVCRRGSVGHSHQETPCYENWIKRKDYNEEKKAYVLDIEWVEKCIMHRWVQLPVNFNFLILQDEFWFVPELFACVVKFQFREQLPVDPLSNPVVSSPILSLL